MSLKCSSYVTLYLGIRITDASNLHLKSDRILLLLILKREKLVVKLLDPKTFECSRLHKTYGHASGIN